jgi:phosphatidylserine/phosphatidylglycerophosphate/cardiolipin synthase-like enzyme
MLIDTATLRSRLPHARTGMRATTRLVATGLTLLLALVALPGLAVGGPRVEARVEAAFDEECEEGIIKLIESADKTIYAAVYTFTNRKIVEALAEARERGVYVQVKLDREQAASNFGKPTVRLLRDKGVSVHTIAMEEARMHHKFLIADGARVATGSYNFTVKASNDNLENLVVIESEAIAQQFLRAYSRIKSKR